MGRTLPNRSGGALIGAKKPAIPAPLIVGICPDTGSARNTSRQRLTRVGEKRSPEAGRALPAWIASGDRADSWKSGFWQSFVRLSL